MNFIVQSGKWKPHAYHLSKFHQQVEVQTRQGWDSGEDSFREGEEMTNNHIQKLFSSLQDRLETNLRAGRKALPHPVAKGESTELDWVNALKDHLPQRYQVSNGFVIDSNGKQSEQIDVVIYDWQYTPLLYNKNEQRFIPAESVYAIFEVRQTLNSKNVLYAGKKISSVRRLYRTSAEIHQAGGKLAPKPLFPIVGGVLTYTSDWKTGIAKSLTKTLKKLNRNSRLDMGCIASVGTFEVSYIGNKMNATTKLSQMALASFMFRLLEKLQKLATVTAIDYKAYNRWLK